jgi:serine phosphatase RsbU (regulator of sigma subunit)
VIYLRGHPDVPGAAEAAPETRAPQPGEHDPAPASIADCVLSSEQRQEMDDRLSTQESELARIIQLAVLPEKLPETPGFSLGAFCLTARDVGGDFYDAIALGPDAVLLVIADVMGSGLPAALFAAKLRTLIRTAVSWNSAPGAVLTKVNQLMFEELSSVDTFITAQLALLEARDLRLQIANAGHCPLLLTSRESEVDPVAPDGMPLGIVPDAVFEEKTVSLRPSSHVLLYTDGIIEAVDQEGELYGQERLSEWFGQATRHDATAPQLRQNFLGHLRAFQGTLKPHDDQTFVIVAPGPLPQAFAV